MLAKLGPLHFRDRAPPGGLLSHGAKTPDSLRVLFAAQMNAARLARQEGKFLVGRMIMTQPYGEWPGGLAVVTELLPDPGEPNIVFQVASAEHGEIGVLAHEEVALIPMTLPYEEAVLQLADGEMVETRFERIPNSGLTNVTPFPRAEVLKLLAAAKRIGVAGPHAQRSGFGIMIPVAHRTAGVGNLFIKSKPVNCQN